MRLDAQMHGEIIKMSAHGVGLNSHRNIKDKKAALRIALTIIIHKSKRAAMPVLGYKP